MEKQIRKTSKFLSLILRHKPEKIGITLDEQGWVATDILLQQLRANGSNISLELLQTVVANNDKKRFAFNEDGSKIRASQGHSVKIDLGYTATPPPTSLYHGTATRFLNSILEKGLIKGSRHHVHLSKDIVTASKVGQRHGKLAMLEIDTQAMHAAGFEFFVSENEVWLTDHIPTQYIKVVE